MFKSFALTEAAMLEGFLFVISLYQRRKPRKRLNRAVSYYVPATTIFCIESTVFDIFSVVMPYSKDYELVLFNNF
jgi:hypothetical protein